MQQWLTINPQLICVILCTQVYRCIFQVAQRGERLSTTATQARHSSFSIQCGSISELRFSRKRGTNSIETCSVFTGAEWDSTTCHWTLTPRGNAHTKKANQVLQGSGPGLPLYSESWRSRRGFLLLHNKIKSSSRLWSGGCTTWGDTWRRLGLLSYPTGSAHFTNKLLYRIAVNDFVVMFCTCCIYCMSVCSGIPPSLLFLRFPQSFLPTIKLFFFLNWRVFPHSNRGSKDRGCSLYILQKTHWSNVTVMLGYINTINLMWFDFKDTYLWWKPHYFLALV